MGNKYEFSEAERQAVFNVSGPKCYICYELLTMKTFEVDHVIPESLEQNPTRLAEVLQLFACSPQFNVNSYENWMPACRSCNGRKLNLEWRPSPLIQAVLQRAAKRADKAREIEKAFVTERRLYNALAVLKKANAESELPAEIKAELLPLVQFNIETRDAEAANDPVRVTPTYTVPLYEVLSDNGITEVVRGPYGIGGGPPMTVEVPSGARCFNCGFPYFSGPRCVICGQMSDD